MTIAEWILLGLIIVTVTLLLISYIKKINLMKKISECLVIPLFAALNVLLLRSYLPDSLHLIKITITVLSLISVSTIFIAFEGKKTLRVAGRFLVLAGICCWIYLYRTIFFIHKVPLWLTIIALAIYFASMIITMVISGKQRPLFYGLFALSFALSAYLNFCSLIFLCFETEGSSVMLFIGTALFVALNAFHFINQARLNFKHAGVIRYSLLLASQVLIACSNILMIR